jgi:hypothetical protein
VDLTRGIDNEGVDPLIIAVSTVASRQILDPPFTTAEGNTEVSPGYKRVVDGEPLPRISTHG